MLDRKRKTKNPCPGCRLRQELCICSLIPALETKTRLCLVIHAKELKRTTNTGQLAVQALKNSIMRVRGADTEALDLSPDLNSPYRSVLFFPCEEAFELNLDFMKQDDRPIQLIVPDGNWRQASKVNTRHPELKDLPRVKISTPNLAKLHLRVEHMPEGMATLEAIAEAFSILEGETVGNQLKKIYEEKLMRTLHGRGVKI